ncbi:MAG: hypothetical protein JW883_11795 [Deltaproteobacteria bacterium]|nr:hypothetical protein [Deltaproteobacteria bacterium]
MTMSVWTKLWILVSAICLLVVGSVTYVQIPKKSDYEKTRVRDTLNVLIQNIPELRDYTWIQLRDRYRDISDEELLSKIHETKRRDKLDFRGVEDAYRRKLDNHRNAVLKSLGIGFLFWIIPALWLYVLGRAIGWVTKGFGRKAGTLASGAKS